MPDAPSATAAAVFALSGATSVTRTAGAKSRDSAGTGGRRRVHADCPGGRGHHRDGHPTPCRCCRRHRPRAAWPPPRHHRDDPPVYEQESLLADCPDPVDRAVLAFAASHPRRCPDALTRSVLELSATAYHQRLLALVETTDHRHPRPADAREQGRDLEAADAHGRGGRYRSRRLVHVQSRGCRSSESRSFCPMPRRRTYRHPPAPTTGPARSPSARASVTTSHGLSGKREGTVRAR